MVIPREVRRAANVLAEERYPQLDVAWTTKDHVRRLRADLREAYLAGWLAAQQTKE
jgi:hypothetical protein